MLMPIACCWWESLCRCRSRRRARDRARRNQLAGWLIGMPFASKSAIAFGMLFAQSPATEGASSGVGGLGNPWSGLLTPLGVSYVVTLAFVRAEEEGFVFDNRAAKAAAELLQCSRSFGAGSALK